MVPGVSLVRLDEDEVYEEPDAVGRLGRAGGGADSIALRVHELWRPGSFFCEEREIERYDAGE